MEQVYRNYEKMKVTSGSGIFITMSHNNSYLLLFRKRKLQNSSLTLK